MEETEPQLEGGRMTHGFAEDEPPTTRADISGWFDRGLAEGADFLIVVCDTFDWGDYPVYASADDVHSRYDGLNGPNMQKVMEVYDLRKDKARQLAEYRAHHLPPRKDSA
jgi:hypothetical protein